ncbi:MAG: prolipoprotein diacylglyceryl transferase [Bacteroidetes bacterium]|nr:prolipoprotein diacylglyceryl transferase [Bacteroidota bacterium]
MNAFIEITTINGQFYFDLFYFLAITFAGIFFMIDGRQKKYPVLEWSLIFSSAIIFFIIGTKLFAYNYNEWKEVISSFNFPYTEKKTVLGGISGGIFGIWIAKKLIHFHYPILDSLAVSFPIAMAIQPIGCFLVGCCFGTPTNVPWAVNYSYHAMPFFTHLQHGLINETSCMSLPIHPIQLYQTLMCLFIAFVIWKLKNKIKRSGNLFFTSVTLYLAARLILEFWRDGISNGIAGNVWMGLKLLQWALLGAVLLMTLFIYIRKRKFTQQPLYIHSFRYPVWYFVLLSVFILMLRRWFTYTEFLFIIFVLTPVTILQINKILGQYQSGFSYRLVSLSFLLFLFVFTGILTAQKTYNDLTKQSTSQNRFNEFSFGYGNFQYSHYHSQPNYIIPPTVYSGCNSYTPSPYYVPVGEIFAHNINVLGIGFTHTETYGEFQKLAIKAEFSSGWDVDHNTIPKHKIEIYNISPSLKYDSRWFGVGFGFHIGKSVKELKLDNVIYSIDNNPETYGIWSGSFRLLPYDLFYTELRFNEMFPYQVGPRRKTAFQYLIGSGFGFKDGSGLEFGADGNTGYFISGKAWFYNTIGIKACFYFIDYNKYQYDYVNSEMQVSISYRFFKKHWIGKPSLQ